MQMHRVKVPRHLWCEKQSCWHLSNEVRWKREFAKYDGFRVSIGECRQCSAIATVAGTLAVLATTPQTYGDLPSAVHLLC